MKLPVTFIFACADPCAAAAVCPNHTPRQWTVLERIAFALRLLPPKQRTLCRFAIPAGHTYVCDQEAIAGEVAKVLEAMLLAQGPEHRRRMGKLVVTPKEGA